MDRTAARRERRCSHSVGDRRELPQPPEVPRTTKNPAPECPGGTKGPLAYVFRALGLEKPRAGAERLPEKIGRSASAPALPRSLKPSGARAPRDRECMLGRDAVRRLHCHPRLYAEDATSRRLTAWEAFEPWILGTSPRMTKEVHPHPGPPEGRALEESAQERCRPIRDADDLVRRLAVEFEIELGAGLAVVPVDQML